MMTCAALVLFMTLPGLALFYGGLVRAKNVLSVLAQCLGIAGLVTILWWAVGYSLVFSRGCPLIGGLKFAFLHGVDARPNSDYSYWVSQNVFAMYQLMFAIITPALIIGAVAERMKFAAVLVFVGIWMFLVYFPIAHMVWGIDGWMNGVWNPSGKNYRDRFRRRNRRSLAAKATDPAEIRDLLVRQVTAMVRWRECVNAMVELGVDSLVELGAGKVLSGLVRRIAPDAATAAAATPAEVEAVLKGL